MWLSMMVVSIFVAVQTDNIWLNIDLEHSSVTVNVNIFELYNSAFLVPKS